jgi:hypothetical protein
MADIFSKGFSKAIKYFKKVGATFGNIKISGNKISSTNTNGNIHLDPNGSGVTKVSSELDLTEGYAQLGFASESSSFTVSSSSHLGNIVNLDISGDMTITIADSTKTNWPIGAMANFFWNSDTGNNSINFTTSGSQTLVSDGTTIAAVGINVTLVRQDTNRWMLVGGLI